MCISLNSIGAKVHQQDKDDYRFCYLNELVD